MAANTHPSIKQMLEKYNLNKDDPFESLREILQEIVLYGLADAGFFDYAAFYGGTALRILYNLPRFSEDLDFSLLQVNKNFRLDTYEQAIIDKLQQYGFETKIETKIKDSGVQSAFLKGNTVKHMMAINAPEEILKQFHINKLMKIKFEVDTIPPGGFELEEKLHYSPSPFIIKTMKKESLFAGKMHAILCRGWSSRPKGRDWYDIVWYISNNIPINTKHLVERMSQACKAAENKNDKLPLNKKEYTIDLIRELLYKRIDELNVEDAKDDVIRFIKDASELKIWSKEFFRMLADRVQFQDL